MPGGQSEGTSSILAKVLQSTARDVGHPEPLLVQFDTLDRTDERVCLAGWSELTGDLVLGRLV